MCFVAGVAQKLLTIGVSPLTIENIAVYTASTRYLDMLINKEACLIIYHIQYANVKTSGQIAIL